MRRTPQPGYVVVRFVGRHVPDPTDMRPGELVKWWEEIGIVAQAITEVYKPCHLNYQILGNSVPHVHLHVVPRYLDDPAPGRPLPDSSWQAATNLSKKQLVDEANELREAAGRAAPLRAEDGAISLVERGYDNLNERYSRWADLVDPPLSLPYLERVFATAEPKPSRAVELGCGPGVPVGKYLAERCSYVGVDISAAMLRQAALNVPRGVFVQADMSRVTFAQGSIDLVVAFHSIIHVPRQRHPELFRALATWLRPGGWLVASLSSHDNPGAQEADWLGGGPMFWSGFDAVTNLKLLKEAGFVVRESSVLDQNELGNPVQFLWVIAQRGRLDG